MMKVLVFLLALLISAPAFAQLTGESSDALGIAATPLSDTDLLVLEQGGVLPEAKLPLVMLKAYMGSGQSLGFFVAIGGSDTNNGTSPVSCGTNCGPFATLQACQTAMQRSNKYKTCYIRGGSYSSGTGYTQQSVGPGGSCLETTALYLTSADNGETWSYYSPDGYNTAIFNGGWNGSTTSGTQTGIWIDGGNNITINGLTLHHFNYNGIVVHGGNAFEQIFPVTVGAASSNTIENNIIHDMAGGAQPDNCTSIFTGNGAGIVIHGLARNNTYTHNALYGHSGMTVRVGACSDGASGCTDDITGTTSSYNVEYSGGTVLSGSANLGGCDYVQDVIAAATGIVFDHNFYRDCVLAGSGSPSTCAPNDDGASNTTRTNNVIIMGSNPCTLAMVDAHGGGSNVFKFNILDLSSQNQSIGQWQGNGNGNAMAGNVASNNIIITAGTSAGLGWNGAGPFPTTNPLIQNNGYFGYGSATPSSAGDIGGNGATSGGCTPQCGDQSPVTGGNPLLSGCWVLSGTSPYITDAVAFPAQTVGWGSAGFWGPPGYRIPNTGTAPSYGPQTC